MSKFYLTDPKIFNLKLQDKSFIVYQHCCSNFNIKKFEPFIRLINIANDLKIGMDQVNNAITNLTYHKLDGLPLVTMEHNGKWVEYDMPSHKFFLERIGFTRLSSTAGYNKVKKMFRDIEIKTNYKFTNLDMYELEEKLNDMNIDEFKKYTKKDFQYPWVYERVKKNKEYKI